LCVILKGPDIGHQTVITGKDFSGESLVAGMVFFIPLSLMFTILSIWFLLFIPLIISVISIHYLSSVFVIAISDNQIKINKSILGISTKKAEFNFKSAQKCDGGIVFENRSDQLKFHFERRHFDVIEYELNSKIEPIGNEKQFGEVVGQLCEYVETRKNYTHAK
jgi:hypothetical protein